jgi:hypothetical protein
VLLYSKKWIGLKKIAAPAKVYKTLIYGGTENKKRTKYNVISWQNISENAD